MPSFTKKAIVESFLHLAGKKPLDKITVRDIVDDCGINRNTFYYYFQDIYAVLEDILGEFIRVLPSEQSLCDTLSAFHTQIALFAATYPHAAKSLALSLGFEGLERYFATDLDGVIIDCYARTTKAVPSPTYLRLLRHAILGLCLDTLRAKKEQFDDKQELERFFTLLSGEV